MVDLHLIKLHFMKGLLFTIAILFITQLTNAQSAIFSKDFAFGKNDTLIIKYQNPKQSDKFLGFESHLLVAPNSLLFVEARSTVLPKKEIEYFYKTDESPFSFNIYWIDSKVEGIVFPDSLENIVELVFVATTEITSATGTITYDDQRVNKYTYNNGTSDRNIDLVVDSEVIEGPDNVNITYVTSEKAEFLSEKRQTLHFMISDILGRKIYQSSREVQKGPIIFEMPSDLPPNQNLILSVSNGSEVFARKFYSSRQ